MKINKMSNITQKWVEIVKPFTRNYFSKMTATEISKVSGVPQQSVSRILSLLVHLNLIDYSMQGKNKLFYFDFEKGTTHSLFLIVEGSKSIDFSFKYEKEALILNKLSKCCEALILFGSYASGKPKKDSDLDIILVGKCDKKKFNFKDSGRK